MKTHRSAHGLRKHMIVLTLMVARSYRIPGWGAGSWNAAGGGGGGGETEGALGLPSWFLGSDCC